MSALRGIALIGLVIAGCSSSGARDPGARSPAAAKDDASADAPAAPADACLGRGFVLGWIGAPSRLDELLAHFEFMPEQVGPP